MNEFSVEIARENTAVLLTGMGELDLAAVDLLERELGRAEQGGPELIVLDLAKVTFVDSSGLRVILSAAARGRETGRKFIAARPTGQVERLLEITGSSSMLEIAEALPAPFSDSEQPASG